VSILYTENRKRYAWNIVVAVSATFLALYIPLSLEFDLSEHLVLDVLYWTCSGILFSDAILKLMKLVRDHNSGTSPGIWQWFGWGLIDLIAAVPIGPLFGTGAIQLIRLVKLIRVAQFFRAIRQQEVTHATTLTLTAFVFWLLVLIHWLCTGWMGIYGVNAERDMQTNYVSALYWVVTTLTSVGYGDIVPVTNGQRLYAILVQLSGIGVFGYVIGNVVSIISRVDAVKARYEEHIELLTTAIKRRHLPQELQKRILDYYTYLRDEKMGYDESAFLESLPESLRTEAALNLKMEFIEGIPLFRNASTRFIIDIALKLELIVETPGDFVFKEGDPGHAMYFIISGHLDVLNTENEIIAELQEGDFFGEIALFKSQPRSASVQAISYCNLYMLDRDTFKEVVAGYPDIAREIEEVAMKRAGRDTQR
jgi:CRP-like cAMP-binding protein